MKIKTAYSTQSRIDSFHYAIQGILSMIKMEMNARIHLAFTVFAFVMGYFLHISSMEFIIMIIVMALVWMAELFNTAIEKSMDLISTDFHPQIKLVKDISAGAVLVCSIAATITGGIIFIPKILLHVQ
jgi:diacylglycerol kinase